MVRQRTQSEWQAVRLAQGGGGTDSAHVAANRDTIPSPWAADTWRFDPRKVSVLNPTRKRVRAETARGEIQVRHVLSDSGSRTSLLQWATYGLFVLCGFFITVITSILSR